MRQRVLGAARELGYVPNQSGRSLRRGRTGVIGFMMQTGHKIAGRGDTFFMSVFDGLQTVLTRQSRYRRPVLLIRRRPRRLSVHMVSRCFAEGIIIYSTQRVDPRITFLFLRKVPFVKPGRSTTVAGQPWFDIDFETIAWQVVEMLVGRGHSRIAITAAGVARTAFPGSSSTSVNSVLVAQRRRGLLRQSQPTSAQAWRLLLSRRPSRRH